MGKDLVLLWLWHRLAATALIGPLSWERAPYAAGASPKKILKRLLSEEFPIMAQWLMNPIRSDKVAGSIPGLTQLVMDLALLWLWQRL